MKKYLLLLLISSMFTFTNCSKEDNVLEAKTSIVGKWYFYSKEKDGELEIIRYGKCGKNYTEFQSEDKFKHVVFKSDCKGSVSYGIYSIKGDEITIKHNNGKTGKAYFEIKGNELILYDKKGRREVYKRL